ncbi:long-chain-fatty-acid--CoA ligase [Sulfobacillus harzensis]|uniref:Long-chain fatty acid--CoA ligase n=1 Tax=Sulfobacillus harzensis TaxID=2729629 RepID=A0A7Y0L4Y9_9FIRM|nr:long-chain fatty acid--CoA ligase [Sulfobacillus harzensis]NMP23305.1 long-chain fatty acid--CoA ligase [Sulfobacillus harzensis]
MQVLTRVLRDNVEEFGEYPFLYDGDLVYSNAESLRQSERIRDLLVAAGIQPGDRVLVSMPNRAEVFFVYQGAMMAGAVVVPVMYLLGRPEIAHIMRDAEPAGVFIDDSSLDKVLGASEDAGLAPRIWSADPSDRVAWLWERGDYPAAAPPELREQDLAVILYTSGTTGAPKGVMLTHKNLYANAQQVIASSPDRDRGVTLGVLPLAHIFGFTVSTVTAMLGSSIVIFRKFDVRQVFEAIQRYRVRGFSAVPAMLYAMVQSPEADRFDLSSLETVSSGSAPCPVPLIEAFQAKFHAEVLEGYGLSEAAPVVSGHRRNMPIKPGTVGVLVSGVEARIVDFEGRELPVGHVGELWVRGDNVSPGYFRRPEATRQVLDADGWLHTGDVACLDEDGYLTIVDRKKDVIIRGGFNIYPRDVEEVLMRHPAIAEAAVVGVPSERLGEEAVAFVTAKPGAVIDEEEVLGYGRQVLAHYKVPKALRVVDALPRNAVGKVMKRTLKEWASR